MTLIIERNLGATIKSGIVLTKMKTLASAEPGGVKTKNGDVLILKGHTTNVCKSLEHGKHVTGGTLQHARRRTESCTLTGLELQSDGVYVHLISKRNRNATATDGIKNTQTTCWRLTIGGEHV
jgi:hypothetical protein